jgi:hypothetical protein
MSIINDNSTVKREDVEKTIKIIKDCIEDSPREVVEIFQNLFNITLSLYQ